MKQFILKNSKALRGTFAILLFGAMTMSFQDPPVPFAYFNDKEAEGVYITCTDTLPEKGYGEGLKMKDFEKLQQQLNRSLHQVNDELKKLDLSGLQQEIAASLKDVDAEKIMKDVELSLKNIDLDKMLAGISSSLKGIDLGYKQEEIEKALAEAKKEIDKAKLELKDINRDAVKKELENARKEIAESKKKIDNIDLDKIMDKARAGIDKAREELNLVKDMFTEMEKDGLIDPKAGFTIEYKNKDLFIDGKKQPEKITGKYRKYFKDDPYKINIGKE